MAYKVLAAEVGLTGRQPMVLTGNSNPGQMQREKSSVQQKKTSSFRAGQIPAPTQHHAAQFHDQSRFLNKYHANAVCFGFRGRARPPGVIFTQNACAPRTTTIALALTGN